VTPPAAASSLGTAQPLPRRRPVAAPRPRRVSGPARPARPASSPPAARRSQDRSDGLIVGLLHGLETLSSHRALDRLIRGRLWIGIVAFALIGIVTLQLALLRLNAGIGRALERESALQSGNTALSIENSELAAGNRVESQASSRLGMKLVGMAGLRFLTLHGSVDVAKAAARLREPLNATGQPPAGAVEAEGSSGSGEATTEASGEKTGETAATAGTTAAGGEQEAGSAASSEASTTAAQGATGATSESTASPSAVGGEAGGGGTAAPGG
jgi:cell division protein FtsL